MPKRNKNIPKDYIHYKKTVSKVIGDRIRTRREKLNLSQEQLRVALQLQGIYISRSQFSRLESGETLPSALEIKALASALDLSYSSLLDDIQITGNK